MTLGCMSLRMWQKPEFGARPLLMKPSPEYLLEMINWLYWKNSLPSRLNHFIDMSGCKEEVLEIKLSPFWLLLGFEYLYHLPNSYVEIPTLKGDGTRWWGLWEALKSWGWCSHEWISAIQREAPESSPLPLCEDTARSLQSERAPSPDPEHAGTLTL